MESFFLWDPTALEVSLNKWQRRIEEHGFLKIFYERSRRVNYAALQKLYDLQSDNFEREIELVTFKELKKTFEYYLMGVTVAIGLFVLEIILYKCQAMF